MCVRVCVRVQVRMPDNSLLLGQVFVVGVILGGVRLLHGQLHTTAYNGDQIKKRVSRLARKQPGDARAVCGGAQVLRCSGYPTGSDGSFKDFGC